MLPNIQIGFFARFFASHHHDGGRMCGCCQMLRLDRKLQWRHPAPAKWDEVRNYTHKTKLHEDAKKWLCNQGNFLFYLECRHFKYQIFSTKPCGSQEIYWKYPILFDHAKRVFLVLPTTFNLVQRITVIVFFSSIRGDSEEHTLAKTFISIEYWKQVILRSNSKRFSSFSLCLPV